MQPIPIWRRAQWLIVGVGLAIMAIKSMLVDYYNNTAYGANISPEMETIMGIAAIGVVAVPAAAAMLGGWNHLFRLAIVGSVVMTVYVAYKAYSVKQDHNILTVEGSQNNYDSAKDASDKAKAELKTIFEKDEAEKLRADLEDAKTYRHNHCGENDQDPDSKCKLAQGEEKRSRQRLSDAERRDKLTSTIEKAELEMKKGPAKFHGDSAEEERTEAKRVTLLGIFMTQVFALLGGYAMELIGNALKFEPRTRKQTPKAKAPVKPTGGGQRQPQGNVIRLDPARLTVKEWAEKNTVAGAETRGGDIRKAYERATGVKIDAKRLKAVLTEIYGESRVVSRGPGYVVTGLQLRASSVEKVSAVS